MVDDKTEMELAVVDGVADEPPVPLEEVHQPEVSSRKEEHLYKVHEQKFRGNLPEEVPR